MHTENAVTIRGPLARIVELAADVERWPVILPHYRWVTLLEGGGDRKIVEMAARRDRIPVKWRAVQEIRRGEATPTIHYRHIRGATEGMEVGWVFEPRGGEVMVRIWHEFTPRWPVVGPILGGVIAERVVGPLFVGYIAGQTLATIKGIVEDEAVSRQPSAVRSQ